MPWQIVPHNTLEEVCPRVRGKVKREFTNIGKRKCAIEDHLEYDYLY